MAWRLVLLLALLLILQLAALFQPYWLRLANSTFSLRRCQDCQERQSFPCFLQQCAVSDLCEAFQGVEDASGLMLSAGLGSILCGLVLFRRLFTWALGRDYGSAVAMYILAAACFFLQFVGVLGYFSLSDGSFGASGTGNDPRLLAGPALSIAVLIGELMFLVLFILVFSRRDQSLDVNLYLVPATYLWRLRIKIWTIGVIGGIAVCSVLMLAATLSASWVMENPWRGGLSGCSDCGDEHSTWDCLAEFSCSAGARDCVLWRRLRDGGIIVISTQYKELESLSAVSLLLWLETQLLLLLGRDFGLPGLNFFLPLFTFVTHWVATMAWFSQSRVSVEIGCSLCASTGASMAITACPLLLATALLSIRVNVARGAATTQSPTAELKDEPRG